jgi:outer membrane lipoprotein-sorting protein
MKLTRLALLLLLAPACVKNVAPPASLAAMADAMQQARSQHRAFSADAKITYFGKEGRAKAGATLAVARPASLRYELHGPHEGVIQAFATNGAELQLLDFQNNRFVYGPSTPGAIDKLMQFAPLHLTADAWVAMLFGDVVIGNGAEVTSRGPFWLARWTENEVTREVLVDPASARVAQMRALRGHDVLSDVEVSDYDPSGIPTTLHMQVPSAKVDLEIRLKDLTIDPELDASVFVLDAPASLTPERIDG